MPDNEQKTTTYEDLLTQQSGGRNPADLAAAIDLKGTSGSRQKEGPMTGADLRQAAVTGVGLGAVGFTGGMSLLPALLIEAGTMSATDFGLRAAGMTSQEERDAGKTANLEGAVESAKVGAGVLATGAVVGGAFTGLGMLGGVGIEGIDAVRRRLPVGKNSAGRFLRDAPKDAEFELARSSGEIARNKLGRTRRTKISGPEGKGSINVTNNPRMVAIKRAEDLIDRVDEIYAANQKVSASGGATTGASSGSPGGKGTLTPELLSGRGKQTVDPLTGATGRTTPTTPAGGGSQTGGVAATEQTLGAGVQQGGIAPMSPIQRFINNLRGTGHLPEDAAQDAALEAFANSLPESMTLRQLTNYIRGLQRPVADQIGSTAGVPVNSANRIKIANFAAGMRDNILGQRGASMFSIASKKIQAVKNFRDLMVDKHGRVKPDGPAKWRNILRRDSSAVRDVFREFDKRTGLNMLEQAELLATRRQWDAPEDKAAVFLLSIIARIARTVSRKGAEGIARFPLTSPRLGPVLVGPTDFGQAMGEGALGLTAGLAEGGSGFVMDQFTKAIDRGRQMFDLKKSHEDKQRQQDLDKVSN